MLYDQLKGQIDTILAAAKTAAEDKQITLKEVTVIGMEVFHGIAILATSFPESSHDERKATLLQVADQFYSSVLAPMDIPYVPAIVENTIVDPALGKVFHSVAEGMIDWVLAKVEGA